MLSRILLFAGLVSVALSQGADCDDTGAARNSTEIAACEAHIKNEPFSADKLTALQACIAQSDRGFTGPQTTAILELFSFSSDQATALGYMNNYLLGMTTKDAAALLDSFGMSDDRLSALKALCNVSAIINPNVTAPVIDEFSFSADKAAALKLLASQKPRSCVYGRVTAPRVVFIVDTSGSMSTTFSLGGKTYSRLSYVAEQLDLVIRYQLDPSYQSMNVLRFSDSVSQWQPAIVPVNADHISSAVSYISSWTPGGGTNMYDSLTAAFSDDSVAAVYFLSDGTPSVGNTNVNDIISHVASLSSAAKYGPVPVNTIALLEGHTSGDDPVASKEIMSGIAAATGGVYRALQATS